MRKSEIRLLDVEQSVTNGEVTNKLLEVGSLDIRWENIRVEHWMDELNSVRISVPSLKKGEGYLRLG